jgi:glucosamine--fructose-6-phosphate aminotransferase (isomerizing)
VILLDVGNEFRDKNMTCFHELKAREANVILITDFLAATPPQTTQLIIPYNKTFGGILANCIIQIMAYYFAIERGLSPDFPRNLAKVVSVD